MYGMVNQAIKSMIIEKMGSPSWEEICTKANLEPSGFASFTQYEDKVTADLVRLVCEKTNQKSEVVLESFGLYWIEYAKKSDYSSMLTAFASNPLELIESLDALHSRLQLSFENLKSPSFWVTHINKNEILVHYKSQRDMGLEYFVVGLLKGIFNLYGQTCQVELLPPKNGESALFKLNF